VTLGSYYRNAPLAKPEPSCVTKKRKQKMEAKNEREARAIVRDRDHGCCRIPNCRERGVHMHHIIYRSKSKRLKWDTRNLVLLCVDHHRLEHAGEIQISGNADDEIVVRGNIDALRFRL
jgi:5-methylcytosine-specific restriction endonuclease McrA